jgi:virulence factor Mce-like protein
MSGLSSRVSINVVTVLVLSVLVVLATFLTLISGVLFDDSYELTVVMPEAGGVLEHQEVTLIGRAVGQVSDVEVTDEGVVISMDIDGDRQVPAEADVQVLRRSPIGEQAVDFQPLDTEWTPAEPDSTIIPNEAITPAEVPFLLEQTVDLFEAIEPEDVSTLTQELAIALDGRGERLRNFNRDSLELNRTLVSGIPEFERLLDTSEPVLAALREHRFDLASAFGSGADLTEIFAEQRPNLETLLDTGERSLDQVDVFTRNTRANFSCLMEDFTEFNELMLGPSTYDGANEGLYSTKLDEFERMLVNNRFFFQQGFNIISQADPKTGLGWTRVHMLTDEEENAKYYTDFRPTLNPRAGAACVSEDWGLGVNAVRQANAVEPHWTSDPIDYAPLAEGERTQATPSTSGSGDGEAEPRGGESAVGAPEGEEERADAERDEAAADLETDERDGPLADTGWGAMIDAIAIGMVLLTLGGLLLLRRRRKTT